MSAKAPAFQFYAKDWLSSAKVQLMPPEYEGAYIRLLAYCWDSGDCSLPDDDQELAALSRLGEGWLKGGSRVVRKCFVPHPEKPGFLTNEKLLEQHQKHLSWREKSKAGGRKSAQQRAEKKEDSKGGSTTAPRVVQPKGNPAYCKLHTANKEDNPLTPVTDRIDEKVDLNDFLNAAEVFRSVLGVGTLSKIDQEILSDWCVRYDIREFVLPRFETALRAYREKNGGKNPGSLAYFKRMLERDSGAPENLGRNLARSMKSSPARTAPRQTLAPQP